ncbi:hypothetical protein E2562_010057 [Oryza meyeriana var. granulata]|uniref:Cytochrome P450 n=1 Tax=Oryza meyeriana var. granulata TaxID=110450 RepID=A0A6G1EIZ9_9ORYZ|nr:hypothetical protein E2562_010057 [Oryza meyeriana var. granulata]
MNSLYVPFPAALLLVVVFVIKSTKMNSLYVAFPAALLLVVVFAINNHRRGKLPPSPPSLPFVGHLQLVGELPHRSLDALYRRYGSEGGLLFLRLGRAGALVVSTATAAADLYKNHDLAFASRPPSYSAEKLFYGERNMSFAPNGDGWRRTKKLAVAHLLSPRRAASFAPARAAEAAALVARARRAAEAGQAVQLRELMYVYTNGVITRVAAGGSGATAERFRKMMADTSELLAGFQWVDLLPEAARWVARKLTGLNKKLDDMAEESDRFLSEIMAAHDEEKAEGEEEDFVDVLLRLRRQGAAAGLELAEDNIKAIIKVTNALLACRSTVQSPTAEATARLLLRMHHYVFLAAVVLLAAVGYGVKNRRLRNGKLPPSAPSLPLLGHLHLIGPLLHRSLHELHLRYGSEGGLLLLQLGRRRTLVVSTAAAAADLYKNHDLAFASRPFSAAVDKLSYGSKNISFAPFGDDWRRAKKMAVVHVLSPRRVESFAPVRAAEAAALVAETRRAAAAADGGAVELRGLLYSYSNAVVTRAATGGAGTTAEKLKQLLGNATSLVAGVQADDLLPDMAAKAVRWATGLEKKYDDTIHEWEKFLSPIMAEHVEKRVGYGGAGEEDFMDVLLRLKEEGADGFELTDTRVKSLVVVMI